MSYFEIHFFPSPVSLMRPFSDTWLPAPIAWPSSPDSPRRTGPCMTPALSLFLSLSCFDSSLLPGITVSLLPELGTVRRSPSCSGRGGLPSLCFASHLPSELLSLFSPRRPAVVCLSGSDTVCQQQLQVRGEEMQEPVFVDTIIMSLGTVFPEICKCHPQMPCFLNCSL